MQTVVIGMSGGVDSSVAAYLLKNQGYNVIGLFMVNWKDDGVCTAKEDYEDVKRVCNAISIPYFSVNYSKEYYENVFEYFLQEYKKGRTPNPDVLCNREIKFKPFLEHAKKLGADYIATGHYAKVFEKNGLFYLAKAKDLSKDQSYFLNQLSQEQLKNVIFPLAEIEKKQVREIAKKLYLSTATKKDSTGICFVGERNFKNFLKNFIPAQPGEIRTINEKVVGKHEGLMFYTLGQRRGLGIGGRADGTGERWFVFKKDLEKNVLYVSQGEGKELFSSGLTATGFNWIPKIPKNEKKLEIGKKKNFCNEQINKEGANENTKKKMQSCFTAKEDEIEFECFAKFRYRQPDQKVKIFVTSSTTIKIEFENKQRAITPGQFVVLYDENGVCLGGGEIENAF